MTRKSDSAPGHQANRTHSIAKTLRGRSHRRPAVLAIAVTTALLSAPLPAPAQQPASTKQPAPTQQSAAATEPRLADLLDAIPPYNPQNSVSGEALLAGSTTMLQLGQHWAARFKQFHPQVEFTRAGDGSQAALELLQKNPAAIAGLSRMVTAEEVAALKQAKCPDPAVVVVAVEPLAVYVHADSPLKTISPQQLQKIFAAGAATTWADLGVEGPLASQAIRVHSRIDDDSLVRFISDAVAGGQPSAKPAATHRSGGEMIKGVAADPAGVAIGSMRSDSAAGVKPLPLSLGTGSVEPTEANFLSGQYPLVRPLTLIFEKSMLDHDGGLRREILKYVLSRDGQAEAVLAGFYPVSPNFIAQQIATLSGPQLR